MQNDNAEVGIDDYDVNSAEEQDVYIPSSLIYETPFDESDGDYQMRGSCEQGLDYTKHVVGENDGD